MNVLISGAGIAGEVAAYWLAKAGAHVTVLEKTKTLLPFGQNIDFDGGAVTVINKMGLMDEIRRNNTTEDGTQFETSNRTVYADLPLYRGQPHFSPTNEYEILRGDLAKVLHGSTKDHPNVKHLFDTTIARVLENNDEHIKVELSNGDIITSDALLIADGQWSKTRKMCFPNTEVKTRDLGAFVAYYTVPRIKTDSKKWRLYIAGKGRVLSIRPDPHGTTRVFLAYYPSNDEDRKKWQQASRGKREQQNELISSTFVDAGWEAERLIKELPHAEDFYFHQVSQIKMDTYSQGRAVLLGDSAYCPTPMAGGGCSLAIQGGYYLAGELSALKTGEHPARAFEAYEHIMRPIADEVQDVPIAVPRFFHPHPWWKCLVVQSVVASIAGIFKAILAVPFIARRVYSAFGGDAHDKGSPVRPYVAFDGEKKY